jgi:protein involved in polysaccharide export with SLBB domain
LTGNDSAAATTNVSANSNVGNQSPASVSASLTETPAKTETPVEAESPVKAESSTTSEAVAAASEMPPTSVYRIGVGDVLDIRLLNTPTSRSTLFTVMSGGLIEYPLVGGSFTAAGLTTDEIGTRLSAELKRRGIGDASQVVVGVRDYTSHAVIVSGLVNYPGTKILRREAVPLYVIAAEAQLRPDASRAVIMRANESIPINDLTDPMSLNVLVRPGDVITVSARQLQYYFIGGRINSPGQKLYQPGLTLIQSILAAGGLSRSQDTVEISREEPDGRLTTTKYVLKEIKSGKIPDPRIQPGDRIEVGH